MSAEATYVITLQFDAATFERLQLLRVRHFPAALNLIPAHLTLLHTASHEQICRLKQNWSRLDALAPLLIRFTGFKSLGRGTALVAEAPALAAVRCRLMESMGGTYSRQDQQSFRPHVTIQNKVAPAVARELIVELSATFIPWDGTGRGLAVWRYLGGPWSLDSVLRFGEP